MNESIYEWYKSTRKLLDNTEEGDKSDTELNEMIDSWHEALQIMVLACPGLKERYERNKAIQESFTAKQIDFICYQIGEWYSHWKNHLLVEGEPRQHRLGYAKEKLKELICGI